LENNKAQVFSSQQFGNVRAIMRDGEPWFVAADVCKALEIGNPSQVLVRLEDDEKMNTLISNEGNQRGNPNMTVVNESGLYALIFGSRKPEAKVFKRWVTSDILPSIRRTGGAGILAGIGPNTPHYQTVGNIRCYESSGVAYLDLEAVAKGLGITKKANSGNEVVHWTRLREYLADFGVVQKCTTGDFIPENIFYRLAMKVRGEVAERFQAFIADEVIPSIRRTGGYVANENMFLNTYLPHADEPTRAMCCERGVNIDDILQNVAA
jgi:prophage antirepressor-like protein